MLIGIDDTACELGVSREALTLELAQSSTPTDAQVEALRRGLLSAVDQMAAEGTLPPASELTDEALQNADLNGLLRVLIQAVPASVIDSALKTDDVLARAITDLDLRVLLAEPRPARTTSTDRSRRRSPRLSRTRSSPGCAVSSAASGG